MNNRIHYSLIKKVSVFFYLITCFIVINTTAFGQKNPENPPRPIEVSVSTAQHLNFGTVIPTSNIGGSLYIDHNGSPTPSGDILLLHSYQCSAALFIVDAEPGVLINIIFPNPDPKLTQSGYYLQMHLGTPNVESMSGFQFITKGKFTYVYVGGILEIGALNANPAGNYSGTFPVIFNQQ